MTDRPIIFSGPMVQALLAGRKFQTRRLLKKPAAVDTLSAFGPKFLTLPGNIDLLPYTIGDRLYVREACRAEELSRPPSTRPATKLEREKLGRTMVPVLDETDGCDGVRFLADDAWIKIENSMDAADRWGAMYHYRGRGKGGIGNNVPSIHMPRWASRLTLTVTDVRVQRLQDISTDDAIEEGTSLPWVPGGTLALMAQGIAKDGFRDLWNSLHGPKAWDANPWVVAVSFDVRHGNIDEVSA